MYSSASLGGTVEMHSHCPLETASHEFFASCAVSTLVQVQVLFLADALSRVMRAAVPIPAVAAVSVLHSAAVGGFVAGDVGPL